MSISAYCSLGRQPDVRVVVVVVDVHVDAADRVHGVGEAGEVHVHDVVDVLDPGQLLHDLQGQLGPTVAVGRVELVDPMAGDVHLQVARESTAARDLVRTRSRTRIVVSDRAPNSLPTSPGRLSDPRMRIVCGLTRIRDGELVLDAGEGVEPVQDAVEEEEEAQRGRRGHRDDDQQRSDGEPRPDSAATRRPLVLGDGRDRRGLWLGRRLVAASPSASTGRGRLGRRRRDRAGSVLGLVLGRPGP